MREFLHVTKLLQMLFWCMPIAGALLFLMAAAPFVPTPQATPMPWNSSGAVKSEGRCQTVTNGASLDVDALFAGVSNLGGARFLRVVYADTASTAPVCTAIGDSNADCSVSAGGNVDDVLLPNSANTILMAPRTIDDLPNISAKSSGANTLVCFSLIW